MQLQKADEANAESDVFVGIGSLNRQNKAKLGQIAMRGAHCGHAGTPIASHMQHDYLPVIEGRDMPCT